MSAEYLIGLLDSYISPNFVWLVFATVTGAGVLAFFLLRYHWNQYLFGGEFIKLGIIKGVFLGVLGILWIVLLIISIIFSTKF